MKTLALLLLLTTLTACGTTKDTRQISCPENLPCLSAQNIAVIGSQETGEPILSAALVGAQRFEQRFGVTPAPIAIVQGGSVSAQLNEQLERAGYAQILPWLSAADKKKLQITAVEKQVLAQTKGMPKAQQEAVLKSALSQISSLSNDTDPDSDIATGALTHELGHLWFIAAFPHASDVDLQTTHSYGGWAPDWLDESAAILLENPALEEQRRKAFLELPEKDFYPLKTFLSMNHPASEAARELTGDLSSSAAQGEHRTVVLTGEEAKAFLAKSKGGDPAKFYTQSRGFIDFLLSRSNDPFLFTNIARYLAEGNSFEQWLTTRDEFPQSLNALNTLWNTWLSER